MRILLAGAMALWAGSALAHDLHVKKTACPATYARVAEIGRALVAEDDHASYIEYSGDEAAKILKAINAVEPVSNWTADRIVAIDPDGEHPFLIALIERDCVTKSFAAPREGWPALVAAAIGSKS